MRSKLLHNDIRSCFLQKLKQKMYDNPENMKKAWVICNSILNKYPPRKNENKFIYGISCERVLIRCMNEFEKCECLDNTVRVGSSYKNDCNFPFLNTQLSIKCTKRGGSIIIINKLNKFEHNILGMQMAIIHFCHRRIYLFTHTEEFQQFVKSDGATIRYKSSLFTYLKKNPRYYYEFPLEFDNYINKNITSQTGNIYDQIVDEEFNQYVMRTHA